MPCRGRHTLGMHASATAYRRRQRAPQAPPPPSTLWEFARPLIPEDGYGRRVAGSRTHLMRRCSRPSSPCWSVAALGELYRRASGSGSRRLTMRASSMSPLWSSTRLMCALKKCLHGFRQAVAGVGGSGAFELFVASSSGVFTADGGAGGTGDWSEAGVGGQVSGRRSGRGGFDEPWEERTRTDGP
jgi:hypothetical protein